MGLKIPRIIPCARRQSDKRPLLLQCMSPLLTQSGHPDARAVLSPGFPSVSPGESGETIPQSYSINIGITCAPTARCPLYPRKRTLELGREMFALCHKRTLTALFNHLVGERRTGRWAAERRWHAVTQIRFTFTMRQFEMKNRAFGRIS